MIMSGSRVARITCAICHCLIGSSSEMLSMMMAIMLVWQLLSQGRRLRYNMMFRIATCEGRRSKTLHG